MATKPDHPVIDPELSRVTQETVQYEFTSWLTDNNHGKDVYDKLHEKHPGRYPKRDDDHEYLYHMNPLHRSGLHEPDINTKVAYGMVMFTNLDLDYCDFDMYASCLQGFLDWLEFDESQPLDNEELDNDFKDTIVDPSGYVKTSPGGYWIDSQSYIIERVKEKGSQVI